MRRKPSWRTPCRSAGAYLPGAVRGVAADLGKRDTAQPIGFRSRRYSALWAASIILGTGPGRVRELLRDAIHLALTRNPSSSAAGGS